jgi:predicted phage terminase large subunit-like protein
MGQRPEPKQAAFMLLPTIAGLYGGAGGGGKSSTALLSALMYVDVPGYSSLVLRRTYKQLKMPGALLDRCRTWLKPFLDSGEVKWIGDEYVFRFPSGATIKFGYLKHDNDLEQFSGSEFQDIEVDEAGQFTGTQLKFLFSRLRKSARSTIPLRYRLYSNPGGRGHLHLKESFVDPDTRRPDHVFVPATLNDNPHIDRPSYVASLMHLPPVMRERILNGDWSITDPGHVFQRHWFKVVDAAPADSEVADRVRYWDTAATEDSAGEDADYTVGARMVRTRDGRYVITDVRRGRLSPGGVNKLMSQTAAVDGKATRIREEQEPGASGKAVIAARSTALAGYDYRADQKHDSKMVRAMPLSTQSEAGNVYIVKGDWNKDFLDEMELFPEGPHDDQTDGASGAFSQLTASPSAGIREFYREQAATPATPSAADAFRSGMMPGR